MANDDKPTKIGGEVGEVRANIDADKLNDYIARHVKAIQAPVSIKQFKVSAHSFLPRRPSHISSLHSSDR